MATLVWDQLDARRYEAGVDRGVLFPITGPGVVWNGLISVDETAVGGDQSFYTEDGVVYLQNLASKDYRATITAFSAPREFASNVGEIEVREGVYLTRQPRTSFGLAYRTKVGENGYKIHLVYNVQANPTSRSYASSNDTPDPTKLEWTVNALPVSIAGFRPTAHFTIDSTKTDPTVLAAVETLIYGTDDADPALPSLDVLVALFPAEGA